MLADSVQDMGTVPFSGITVPSGPRFPTALAPGYLFIHQVHGLCCSGLDLAWRKVSIGAAS